MAKHNTPKAEEAEEKIEHAIDRTEEYIMKNGRTLLIVLAAIVVVVGGWMAYKHLYLAKRSEKAAAMMYVAQQNFAQKLWDVAVEGDGNNAGFLDVISRYGGTAEGNLAKHYAGVSYLKLGDTDKAADYLASYNTTKGVPNAIVNAENYGLRGDILADKGDMAAAADMYAKAVKEGNDPYTSPMYLKKMGLALVAAGRQAEAIDAYQRILDEYPVSLEARDIEKYIGAAEQL